MSCEDFAEDYAMAFSWGLSGHSRFSRTTVPVVSFRCRSSAVRMVSFTFLRKFRLVYPGAAEVSEFSSSTMEIGTPFIVNGEVKF